MPPAVFASTEARDLNLKQIMTRNHNSIEGQGAQPPASLTRRHFLRGLGASVALPAFASLFPSRLMATSSAGKLAVTATGAPLRTAFVYFPKWRHPARLVAPEAGHGF